MDASTLTQSEIALLAEMKIELNEKLLAKTTKNEEKASKKPFDVNDEEFKSKLFSHMRKGIK